MIYIIIVADAVAPYTDANPPFSLPLFRIFVTPTAANLISFFTLEYFKERCKNVLIDVQEDVRIAHIIYITILLFYVKYFYAQNKINPCYC